LGRFTDAYDKKYSYRVEPDSEEHGIYVLRPLVAHTWTEQDFPRGATRWVF